MMPKPLIPHRSLPLPLAIFLVILVSCAPEAAGPAVDVTTVTSSYVPLAQNKTIDDVLLGNVLGAKPEVKDRVVKLSFPRTDIPVEVDGNTLPPFMGLTSWTSFMPSEKPAVEAMVMGDLVLFEDEVGPAMSAALDNGLAVTALHNHFFFDKPRVYFMHISGEGRTFALAKAVKAVHDAQVAVRQKSELPQSSFGSPAVTVPSRIDGAKLDAVFRIKGTAKDGMYKVVIGRKATASTGDAIGKAMGVNTWAAFAGTDDSALVDGDFAVTESELQPVLKALKAGNIHVVAIHSHMTGENPRILFLHFWGRGPAQALGTTLERAVNLTESEVR